MIWYCPRCGEFEAEPLSDGEGYSELTICPSCGGLVGYPEEYPEEEEYK